MMRIRKLSRDLHLFTCLITSLTIYTVTSTPTTTSTSTTPALSTSTLTSCSLSTSSPSSEPRTGSKTPIYVGGFFPIEGHPTFESLPNTVQTAIDHVNELQGILDGYELRMRWNWTMGNPANALRLLHDFVSTGPTVTMTWGPLFSSVATVVNEIAPEYNLVQVVLATSSILKDRSHYPLTLQISSDEDVLNPARVAFVKLMGWKRVAIIFDGATYREDTNQLTFLLHQSGVNVLAIEAVTDLSSVDAHLDSLKRHDARIILAQFLPDDAVILFCKIFQQGLYGSKFIWIIPGWFPEGWWKSPDPEVVSCTSDQMEEVLQYHIGIDGDQFVPDVNAINFNGVKPLPHHLEHLRILHEMDDNALNTYAYDNLITMALILNASIEDVEQQPGSEDAVKAGRLEDFTYDDKDMAKIFIKNAGEISFVGLTDKIEIAKEGTRNSPVYVEQFIGSTVSRIMIYSNTDGSFTSVENNSIRWAGGNQPVHGMTYRPIDATVSSTIQIIIYSLSSLGIVSSLIFLALNVYYREYRTIKISSPILNNLIVIGCLMLYVSIFIPGLDTSRYSERVIVVLCHIQTGLISVGISLSLGALFTKTYRIHAIFKKAVGRFKKINLPDSKLILGVCSLVFIDIILLLFRVVLDDVHVTSHPLDPQLDMTDPAQEVYIVPTVRTCESTKQIFFQIIMYGIKGILLVFGIFLAWETRDVTVSDLNDSKYIAVSVYTVAVTMSVAVPIITVFMYQVDLRFIIFSSAILFANTTVLCLVFVPKIMPLCCCDISRRESSHMTYSLSHVMKRKGTSTSSSSNAFHFQSADEGVKKLNDELEKKRQELTSLQLEYEKLSMTMSPHVTAGNTVDNTSV